MGLLHLHSGIFLESVGVRIPWLISEPDLFQIVPENAFTRSGNWPMLRCTVLGMDLVWGFNFVTHDKDLFIGLRFDSYDRWDGKTSKETFAEASTRLLVEFGPPNRVNEPDSRLRWQDDWACVTNSIATYAEPDGREVLWHSLYLYALSANPKIYAYQRGRAEPS